MSKKIVVIMNDDPRELRTVEINTVYKYEHLGVRILTINPLSSITKLSDSLFMFWRGFYELDRNNPLSSYVESFMFKPGIRETIKDYYIIELDVPEECLDNVIKEMKEEPYILKIDNQLSAMGLIIKEGNDSSRSGPVSFYQNIRF